MFPKNKFQDGTIKVSMLRYSVSEDVATIFDFSWEYGHYKEMVRRAVSQVEYRSTGEAKNRIKGFFTISLHKIWGRYGGFWMLFIECCWVPPWTFPLSDDTRSKGMALSIWTKSGIVPYHPRPYVIRLKDTSQTKHEKTDSVALHKQIPYGFSPYFKISVVLANLRDEHASQAP